MGDSCELSSPNKDSATAKAEEIKKKREEEMNKKKEEEKALNAAGADGAGKGGNTDPMPLAATAGELTMDVAELFASTPLARRRSIQRPTSRTRPREKTLSRNIACR